jgi:hypothetical protein
VASRGRTSSPEKESWRKRREGGRSSKWREREKERERGRERERQTYGSGAAIAADVVPDAIALPPTTPLKQWQRCSGGGSGASGGVHVVQSATTRQSMWW